MIATTGAKIRERNETKRPNALHERERPKQKGNETIARKECLVLYLVPGLLHLHTLVSGAAAS
jgi:hypothetical protein